MNPTIGLRALIESALAEVRSDIYSSYKIQFPTVRVLKAEPIINNSFAHVDDLRYI
jgi:hypothetical protein